QLHAANRLRQRDFRWLLYASRPGIGEWTAEGGPFGESITAILGRNARRTRHENRLRRSDCANARAWKACPWARLNARPECHCPCGNRMFNRDGRADQQAV